MAGLESGAPHGNGDHGGHVMRLTLDNVKGLTTVLQAIKPGSKQICSVIVDTDGMSIRWEDDSKTLQSSIYLRSELFSSYECLQDPQAFGLQFNQLVDTLSTFACASEASSLLLSYPGPEGELQLEMRDPPNPQGGGPTMSMYARISCLDLPEPGDMTEYWADPVSYFLIKGTLLKEAVEDLEWPNGPVVLAMQRDPQRLTLRATGVAGSLEVELPTRELLGFSAAAQHVSYTYAYRNLRAAFSNIPTHAKGDTGSISTKVSIDASGLLKVTHMMSILGRGQGGGAGGRVPGGYGVQPSMGFTQTQAGTLDASRVGRVQFVSVPQLEEENEDEQAAAAGNNGDV